MDRTIYPLYVQEWMDTIEQSLGVDSARLMEYCDKLMEYAQKNHLNYLKGFALFFRGYGFYSMAQLEESMSALSAALNYLVSEEDWFMAARTYNAMGNLADFQGDLSLATDCYCKGLVISREHELGLLSYSISSNISNIHISLGQLEHAVDMLRYCEQLTDEGLVAPITSRIVICANLATSYTRLGRFDEAKRYLELLLSLCGDDRSDTTRVIIYIIRAELYHSLGDAQERDAAIAELNSMELMSTTIYDALTELCRHAMMLLDLGKFEEFLSLLSQIEERTEGFGVEKQLIDLRMKYYKQIGDESNCEKTALRYYDVVGQNEEMRNKVISHNITTRMHLDEVSAKRKEIERTNLMLKQKSERDALTGMNNRYKLNEISELAFHRAYTNGTALTVEILDIDYYKQFNDNYGHQAGDECLVRIAEAIRSMEEYDGVFTARYGGDEFVVIYEDYTFKQVEMMAKMLRQKIHDLNIEHRYSKVADHITISQGLFHRIPAGSNKPWDFLHCADMALYGVKSRSRDSYYIGTSLDDVRKLSEKKK